MCGRGRRGIVGNRQKQSRGAFHEYQTSKTGDQERAARLSGEGRVRRVAHSAHPAAAGAAHRPSGHRQDPDHAADRGGDRRGTGFLYADPPHAAVRARTAVYRKGAARRRGAHGDELHDERDHRIGLPRDRAHGRFRGHPVPRRDQLHLGDADADDAPVFAVQNVRQSAAPGRMDGRGGRKSARVQ